MTEDDLANSSEGMDTLVKITPTGETGEISGYDPDQGFLIDVGLPPCPTCHRGQYKSVWVPFDDLEVLGEINE